jgi:hypothetical protein
VQVDIGSVLNTTWFELDRSTLAKDPSNVRHVSLTREGFASSPVSIRSHFLKPANLACCNASSLLIKVYIPTRVHCSHFMPIFYLNLNPLLTVESHTHHEMANNPSKHAASEGWNSGEVATSRQNDDRKTSLETLPYDILFRLLSLSLEPNLIHTSRVIREKLSRGLGGEKAFSTVAKSIILVALLPPSSWAKQLSTRHDFSILGVERSRNTAELVLLQEQVVQSSWFHPRVVRLLLPQLMKISLERIMGTAEASSTLQVMCEQYPNFLTLGIGPRGDCFFEYLSSDGIKTRFLVVNSFVLRFPIDPTVDLRHVVWTRDYLVYVAGMCHMPDALLECACLGTEESIQLVWMFHEMMRISEQAHEQENSGVFPVSINEVLLAHAIETNLSLGNVDAVRTLVSLHEFVAEIRAKHSNCQDEALIKPRWYLLAARSPEKLMLHNLAILEELDEDGTGECCRSIPYWDDEFVEALSRLVRAGVDRWTLEAYARVLRARQELYRHKSPDGDWMRLSVVPPLEIEADNYQLSYSSWIAHRENRTEEMAGVLRDRWTDDDLDLPELELHEEVVWLLEQAIPECDQPASRHTHQ